MGCSVLLRRRFVYFTLATIMALPAGSFAQVPKDQPASAAFSLTITARNSSIKAGAAVWIDVNLQNKSDHDLSLYRALSEDMDQGGWVYRVDIRDTKEEAPPQTEYGKDIVHAVRSGGYMKLKRGESLTERVNVSKLYDLSRPGKYSIQFQRLAEESKSVVVSNQIAVTLSP